MAVTPAPPLGLSLESLWSGWGGGHIIPSLNCIAIVWSIGPGRRSRPRPWEQGWRSGESARLLPMWPGFKSRRQRHMWVEFVVVSLPCSGRFFSGYSGFPLSSKTNISKFHFDQESGRQRTTMWMCYPQIVIYLFIYYSICISLSLSSVSGRISEYPEEWVEVLQSRKNDHFPIEGC